MTNEEAIEILEECWRYSKTYKCTDAEIREAFDMAIEALKHSEKFQQKAEVVISQLRADRDRLADAIEKIKAEIKQVKSIMNEEIINHDRKDLINFVNGLNQSLAIIDTHTKESEGEE